jgi:hypothetical protein
MSEAAIGAALSLVADGMDALSHTWPEAPYSTTSGCR